jgi:hypothetical protein
MKYSVYMSLAQRLRSYGQKEKALEVIKHANSIEEKKINQIDFDILVGRVKPFKGAKFDSVQVLREKEGNTIMCIFKSGVNNTHRINSTIKSDGSLVWCDGNLFENRLSVNNFNKLVNHLKNYNKDIRNILEEMSLVDSEIKVVPRTYYK